MRSLRVTALAVLSALGLTAPAAAAPPAIDHDVTEIAHRGASFEKPENTLTAFQEGIDDKVDLIEIDVQRSKDGVLVVIHDTDLRRTTNAEEVFPGRASYEVGDFTYDELQQLDAGSWKGAEFTGERIPTLQQTVDLVRRSRVGLLIEVKSPELYPGLAEQLAEFLDEQPGYLESAVANDRLVVQSFNWDFMREFNRHLPQVTAGLLGHPPVEELSTLSAWVDQVNPRAKDVDQAYVDAVHAAGMRINVWTVDSPAQMRRLINLGVDGIITNQPDTLDGVLRAR
ncbi:glycerophosphodiester phosphodiesterase [Kytococcus sp. Marseille-QA3725]